LYGAAINYEWEELFPLKTHLRPIWFISIYILYFILLFYYFTLLYVIIFIIFAQFEEALSARIEPLTFN